MVRKVKPVTTRRAVYWSLFSCLAEYALSGISKPIGVAEYQLVRALPVPLDSNLPSIEKIEAELGRVRVEDEH